MDGISKETFEKMDDDSRQLVLFDYLHDQNENCKKCMERIELVKQRAEKRWQTNALVAAMSGFVGGIMAHLGQLTILGHK